MEQLHEHEHEGYAYSNKIYYALSEKDQVIIVMRGNFAKDLKEFSVSYRTILDEKYVTVRRHCWQADHDKFHTHVRIGTLEKKFKTIYPPPIKRGIKKTLNWSINDIQKNWYHYCIHLQKLVKWENKQNEK